jgi:hypothetical protein
LRLLRENEVPHAIWRQHDMLDLRLKNGIMGRRKHTIHDDQARVNGLDHPADLFADIDMFRPIPGEEERGCILQRRSSTQQARTMGKIADLEALLRDFIHIGRAIQRMEGDGTRACRGRHALGGSGNSAGDRRKRGIV